MAGDRTIAPSPARVRQAWRAGLRPGHRWLAAAASVAAVAAVSGGVQAPSVEPLRRSLASSGGPELAPLWPWIVSAAAATATLAFAAMAGWVLVGAVAGTLGPARGHLHPPARPAGRRGDTAWLVLGLLGAVGVGLVVAGVVAGAARAPTATLPGLRDLWAAWAWRLGIGVAIVMAGLGTLELWIERRRLHLRLWATPEELRRNVEAGRGSRR